jgi:hypothetical protein
MVAYFIRFSRGAALRDQSCIFYASLSTPMRLKASHSLYVSCPSRHGYSALHFASRESQVALRTSHFAPPSFLTTISELGFRSDRLCHLHPERMLGCIANLDVLPVF